MIFAKRAHEYQKTTINYLLKNPSCGVFLDMGMGKTASVLFAFKWLKLKGKATRMLIIAPKFVALHTWKSEIEKWEDFQDFKINIAVGSENKRLDAFSNPSDIVIINRENVNWMMKSVSMKSFQVLVIDELSSFKNHQSKRTLSLYKIIARFKYRWGLTGTPCPNTYLDIFGQMMVLNPDWFGYNFYSFRNKYFKEYAPYKWDLKDGMGEMLEENLKQHCISLTAKDYLKMPKKIENHIPVYMSVSETRIYKKAVNDLVYLLDNNELDLKENLTIKLQQLASGFIYPDRESKSFNLVHKKMLDKLEEIVEDSPGNILLFYNFQAEKELIKSKFKVTELKSVKSFEDWNNDKIKIGLCHPVSVGYGMNLQSGGNTIIWYGYNWAADTTEQANARLYRQGQKNGVVINYLYCAGTIHDRIRNVLEGKIKRQDLLIEAVKYCKELIK